MYTAAYPNSTVLMPAVTCPLILRIHTSNLFKFHSLRNLTWQNLGHRMAQRFGKQSMVHGHLGCMRISNRRYFWNNPGNSVKYYGIIADK